MVKTYAYIDGYNLYHGLMDPRNRLLGSNMERPFRKYLWLNLLTYIQSFLPSWYSVEKIHYVTAPVVGDEDALRRQKEYWKALESLDEVQFHFGKRGSDDPTVDREKQSDVRLALQLYEDALSESAACLVLLCADSDQVPTIERVVALGKQIEVRAIFPPSRGSDDLRKLIPNCHKSDSRKLHAHQFPDEVSYSRNGHFIVARRPLEWT